jgi:hypothetical protein
MYDTFDEGTRLASAFTALADETRSLALLSRYKTRPAQFRAGCRQPSGTPQQ